MRRSSALLSIDDVKSCWARLPWYRPPPTPGASTNWGMAHQQGMKPATKWVFGGIASILVLIVLAYTHSNSGDSAPAPIHLQEQANPVTQQYFESVYTNQAWGSEGGGSGLGSTVDYTCNIRSVIRAVVNRYNIKSMIDLPCGSMAWMPLALEMINEDTPGFRYLGVDIVATQIEKHRANLTRHPVGPGDPTWEFGVLDITKEPIPEGFDLLFSRDALQHLNMGLVLNALENIARTKAKYFLVGSYKEGVNKNINMATGMEMFPIDLRQPPFELTNYIRFFDEHVYHKKGMLLYDMKTLRAANWKKIRERATEMYNL